MATDFEFGQLAEAVYGGPGGTGVPDGMQDKWEVLKDGDGDDVEMHTDNGYFGQAFRNKETNEIVIASRGSRRPGSDGSYVDWVETDIKQIGVGTFGLTNNIPGTFKDSAAFAKEVNRKFPDSKISFTGHSKGGAEAEYAAGAFDQGSQAVTFASPGAAFALSKSDIAKSRDFIKNYSLPGDWVPTVGNHVGSDIKLDPTGSQSIKNFIFNTALPVLGPLGWLIGKVLDAALIHPMGNYLDAMIACGMNGISGGGGGGMPQARILDMHTCPMVTGLVPHVGGLLAMGEFTVFVGNLPAGRITDTAICVGPPDMIAMGSGTVYIGNLPAARMGDMTVHGGVITVGCPTVLTGG